MDRLNHATKICPGICTDIFFLTTIWNSTLANKLLANIEGVRKNGIRINSIYLTERGMASMPM